jgi:hypothetical protein
MEFIGMALGTTCIVLLVALYANHNRKLRKKPQGRINTAEDIMRIAQWLGAPTVYLVDSGHVVYPVQLTPTGKDSQVFLKHLSARQYTSTVFDSIDVCEFTITHTPALFRTMESAQTYVDTLSAKETATTVMG